MVRHERDVGTREGVRGTRFVHGRWVGWEGLGIGVWDWRLGDAVGSGICRVELWGLGLRCSVTSAPADESQEYEENGENDYSD